MRNYFIFFFLFLTTGNNIYAQQPSKKAKEYFDKVISLVETNYYFIDSIDFAAIKSRGYSLISNARRREDTYDAIDTVLDHLYDHHHFFFRPQVMKNLDNYEQLIYPSGRIVDKEVGYIKIPPMIGHFESIQAWSDSLRRIYDKMQSPAIKGWIIDLRGDKGGALGPMIAGLYPFFGDTTVFSLKHSSGIISTFKFLNGYFTETKNGVDYGLLTYRQGNSVLNKKKVAVLIDNRVGSSGEITAIALKGLTNTRFFGTPTAGIPTSTWSHRLPDKALLGFVEGVHFDIWGRDYKRSIAPDVLVNSGVSGDTDEVIQKAIEWLLGK